MKNKDDYKKHRKEVSEILLRIPEGPGPRPEGGFFEVRGGAGHHSYQHYAQHCLNEQGGEHSLEAFTAKFTAWTLEDAGGVVLYPEGPAFKVLQRHFTEGEEPVIYHAEAAYYSALMLCLHPTVYAPGASGNEQLASYEVLQSLEPGGAGPGGYTDHPVVAQKTIATTGEIFMIKFNYYPHKVSYKIRIFPSPAGRNNIFMGGRLGTIPSESI
jgi:hypothetical protein